MPTPAEQYRALVARLEALQESPISAITQAPAQTASSPDQQPNMDPRTSPGAADNPSQVPPQ